MHSDVRRASQPSAGVDYIELQRAALRQWIDLSAEAVQAAEAPIEHQVQSASKAAQRRYEQACAKVEQYLQSRLQTARRHYEEQIQQIESSISPTSDPQGQHRRAAVANRA